MKKNILGQYKEKARAEVLKDNIRHNKQTLKYENYTESADLYLYNTELKKQLILLAKIRRLQKSLKRNSLEKLSIKKSIDIKRWNMIMLLGYLNNVVLNM